MRESKTKKRNVTLDIDVELYNKAKNEKFIKISQFLEKKLGKNRNLI